MSHQFIVAKPDKCIGCGICEFACSGFKEKVYNIHKSRIRIVKIGPSIMMAVACRLCEKPPCVDVCPRKALSSDSVTGIILVDEKKCDGCGWCIYACEYGAISISQKKKSVQICDLCKGELKPKCILTCPKDALELTTPDALAGRLRSASVLRLTEEAETQKNGVV